MAISANTVRELNASATANNVNGGGFNPANANMMTDLTTDSNTANTSAPVVSSASYNFVAGDVGHWLYIKSGTNRTPGRYKITSVASNKATVNGTIGQAIQSSSTTGYPTPRYFVNTVVGCATVGTPTAGTFTIDYSQGTTAIINGSTDFTSVGSSSTLTSVTGGFTKAMIGNMFHQTTTGTGGFGVVGWYEVVNVASGTSLTLDRTPNTGTASVACTGYIGGAMSMNSTLDDDIFEVAIAGNIYFVKSGNYTIGETVTIAASGGSLNPIIVAGYSTLRGDYPTDSNRPSLNFGSAIFTAGAAWWFFSMQFTSTATSTVSSGQDNTYVNCKFMNTSTSTGRNAILPSRDSLMYKCEVISYRGRGISIGSGSGTHTQTINCYIHDCDIGILMTGTASYQLVSGNIIMGCVTAAIDLTAALTAAMVIQSNTIYGAENKLGVGIRMATGVVDVKMFNNIIAGFVTGISHADSGQMIGFSDYNDFYNNTTNATNRSIESTAQTINPSFTNVAQLTGSTATTSGSVLTQSGGDFSTVVDGRDYIYLVSGSGITVGKYGIVSHTSTTVTLDIAPGGSASVTWQITTGRNFAIGTNLKALGYPGIFPGGLSTGYMDIGAVQRQETGGQKSFTF